MDPNRVINSLSSITRICSKILDDKASTVIASAIAELNVTKRAYDWGKRNQNRLNRPPEPWGYTIYDSQPLRFIPVKIPNSVELQVDIYCDIRWAEDDLPTQQDIKVRVWCLHEETIFRDEFDAERIFEELEDDNRSYFPRPHKKSRVISRVHFDKANPDQAGPLYHLQFGGISQPYELFWHPEKINGPRLEYQPMDLFLTCQMVVANFFPEHYSEIRKRPEWQNQVTWCQDKFLRQHYKHCHETLENKQTLLDVLWGITT